jgi:hypothetical protein
MVWLLLHCMSSVVAHFRHDEHHGQMSALAAKTELAQTRIRLRFTYMVPGCDKSRSYLLLYRAFSDQLNFVHHRTARGRTPFALPPIL